MTDSEVLAAEYRAFVKALHPASIEALVAVSEYWTRELWPLLPKAGESPLSFEQYLLVYQEFNKEVAPRLMILVTGHPDPEVRDAAEVALRSLTRALNCLVADSGLDINQAEASEKAIDGLRTLRRVLYRAPFRIERPEPRFNGELLEQEVIRSLVRDPITRRGDAKR